MSQREAIRAAFAAMQAAEDSLPFEERRRMRAAARARKRLIDAAGSYRDARRDARGRDVPERRNV